MTVAPWAGMVVAVAAGAALVAGLTNWQARGTQHPELVRKLLHVGIGLIALSFPILFRDAWPVFAVVGTALLILGAVRNSTFLRRRLGGILDGVTRTSWGDVYFLVAVAILFVLSGGDALLFGVPILVLTFADSAAALVGVRYGRTRYAIAYSNKSVEGSVAFFVVAFLCAQIPILLLGDGSPAAALAAAGALACVTTVTEALCFDGLDNLLVPLAAFAGLVLVL